MSSKLGFFDLESYRSWVGRSPAQLDMLDRESEQNIQRMIDARKERSLSTEERVAANFAEIAAATDPAVLEAPRVAWKTLATVKQALAEAEARLREHLENPPATPAQIDKFVDKKLRLEMAIPLYRDMVTAPQEAYNAALEAARAALRAAWQPRHEALHRARTEVRKTAQQLIDDADRESGLMDSVQGYINRFNGQEPT